MKDRLAVITRIHYEKDDPKFIGRVETYRKYTLPSLLNQTDQDFDIFVWCEPHHDELFMNLNNRINVIHGDWKPRARTGKYFIDYTPYSAIRGLDRYIAQLGVDSDDELLPTAVEEVKKHLNGDRKAISIQPTKHDTETGKNYRMKSYQKRDKLAPIFCIYQPDDPYLFIYEYGHYSGMPLQFKNKIYLGELAIMNIHGENESTKANVDNDEEI